MGSAYGGYVQARQFRCKHDYDCLSLIQRIVLPVFLQCCSCRRTSSFLCVCTLLGSSACWCDRRRRPIPSVLLFYAACSRSVHIRTVLRQSCVKLSSLCALC